MYLCGDKPVYDEEGIWEMVDGYSQIRDDGSAVVVMVQRGKRLGVVHLCFGGSFGCAYAGHRP